MQFLIVSLALVAAASAQYGGTKDFSSGKPVAILRQASDISPDGSYTFNYETENGIAASESGAPKAVGPEGPAVVAEGQFQYPSPDGSVVALKYVANEFGFQPEGAHLPVPPVGPEIPKLIERALAWIAAHPSQEQKPGYKPY